MALDFIAKIHLPQQIQSKNQSVQVFIRTSYSDVGEKLAIRGIVWLSNGKGGGIPGNMIYYIYFYRGPLSVIGLPVFDPCIVCNSVYIMKS